jgi:hypothetical protein
VGLGLGPCFEGDVNEHVNDAYYRAYASVDSDLVAGDRIRSLRLSVAVLPYIRITDNAAVELGFVQKLFGYDTPAAQTWTGGVRTTF